MRLRRAMPVLYVALWLVMLLYTAWTYRPGLEGPSLLDDQSNLNVLEQLEEQPFLARDTVLGNRSGPLGRPVSMFSFTLEKLYFDQGVRGQKRTNLLLHLACGSLVLTLFLLLWRSARLPAAAPLAFLLAAAWLVSPLLLSTVLYPVQRMAQLATFFMLATLNLYLLWRTVLWRTTTQSRIGNVILLLTIALCISLGILAKENAVTVLAVLAALEIFWLRERIPVRVTVSLLAGAVLVLFLGWLTVDTWGAGYANRSFTLWERLLTQGRLLWDYIGQTWWPDVVRMGLYHDDIPVSRSLWSPPVTLLAWSAWGLFLPAALWLRKLRDGRLVLFAISFFLLGHVVESSVLPLELYFEHRNYFPSVGLWLLVGIALAVFIGWFPQCRRVLLVILAGAVLVLSLLTASQAVVWSREELIRLSAVAAHPQSYRANTNMAVLLARYGDLQGALDYERRAAPLRPERMRAPSVRQLLLSCYANQPLPEPEIEAMPIWRAQGRVIGNVNALHFLVARIQDGRCPDIDAVSLADRFARLLLGEQAVASGSGEVYAGLAVLENALQRYDNALAYATEFARLEPQSVKARLMQLHFARALGREGLASQLMQGLGEWAEQGRLTDAERYTLSLYREN